MTERLSDVSVRIGSVQQLSAVITAMRGIAAARSREARSRLDGVRAYARTIAEAIGQAVCRHLPRHQQRSILAHDDIGVLARLGIRYELAGDGGEQVGRGHDPFEMAIFVMDQPHRHVGPA